MNGQTKHVVRVPDGGVPISRLTPKQPGPLLVIVPSIFGVTPDVVGYAKRFAERGALVYAIDPFWRQSPGPLSIPDGAPDALNRMRELLHEDALSDLVAVVSDGLRDDACSGPVILLGICFGGRVVVRGSQQVKTSGLAVWHGANIEPHIDTTALAGTIISIDYGGADAMIPMAQIDAVRSKLTGLDVSIRVHARAGHGFTHRGTSKEVPAAADASEEAVFTLIDSLI